MKKAQKIEKTVEAMTKVIDRFAALNAVATGNEERLVVISFYDHDHNKLFSTDIKNIKKLDSTDEIVDIFKYMIPEFPEIRKVLKLSIIARRNILAICKRTHMADLSKARYIAVSTVQTVDYDCRYVYGFSIKVHTGQIMYINNTVNVDDYSALRHLHE